MSTPTWLAATPVQPPQAGQVNQFLSTHAANMVYTGAEKDNQSTVGAGSTSTNSLYIAQSFTTTSAYTSGRVVLDLAVTGAPTPMTISLRSNNAGAPSSTVLATIQVPASFTSAGGLNVSMPLSTPLTNATTYWIVVNAVGDPSNHYSWLKSNQVTGASTSPDGVTWTAQAYGLLFQIWDNTVVPPLVHTWEDAGARWTTQIPGTTGTLSSLKEYTTAQAAGYLQSAAALGYSSGQLNSVAQGATAATTPPWSAARSGPLGDPGAVDGSAQVNQFLGTHASGVIYQGNKILTPAGTGGLFSGSPYNTYDKAQPFTMVGTSIGRVQIPVIAYGDGADLIVSLCADNAGVPGTVIAQTRVPASWFTTLGKYSAVLGTSPVQLIPTNSPLATAQSNTFTQGGVAFINYTSGTPGGGGYGGVAPMVMSDGSSTIVIVGGQNAANNFVTNVWSIAYEGTNSLANMVPQPALPIGLGNYSTIAITQDPSSGVEYVIVTGGSTGNSGSYTTIANVYASQLMGSTGEMSAWSTQTSLPQAMQTASSASSDNYVYVVGGVTPSNTVLNTVYWANVQNGQITAWNTGPSLPVGVYFAYTVCINGFLVVAGGLTQPGNTGSTTAVWYAKINSDGSLGSWQSGPSMPFANFGSGQYFQASNDGLIVRGFFGPNGTVGLYSLVFDANGPEPTWQSQNVSGGAIGTLLENGPGQYYWFENFILTSTIYFSAGFVVCPYISVPLPATGLTNGATYHVVLQEPAGAVDLNNTLINVVDASVFPGGVNELVKPRGTTTWSSIGFSLPMTVYDNSAVGMPIHTYEDGGERFSTLINATTPDKRLIGIVDAVQQPGPILNANPTFTTGTGFWTGANGTLTQSNAFTHGNLPFSAKLVPDGVSSQAYMESELIPVEQLQSLSDVCWFYSPTGYTNCNIQINWYTAAGFAGGFISSTNGATVNVAAGTWTPFNASNGVPPATAAYATIGIYEKGSPPSSAVFYVSDAVMSGPLGPLISSAVMIDYAGEFGTTGMWPPIGATQL